MDKSFAKRVYPVEEAVRAQAALRSLAGMGPEMFPLEAFVGMISDEIEALRANGFDDERIAEEINANSKIVLTAEDIAANYVIPDLRHPERTDPGHSDPAGVDH